MTDKTSTKEEYIESHILNLLHQWTNIATEIGALLIISLSILDYFVTPQNFKLFLLYRVIAASAVFLIYLIHKQGITVRRHHIVTILTAIIVSGMVAMMIAKFGGHQSPYFAGIILTIIFVIGLAPLNIRMSIIAAFIMYAIYVIPILFYDNITNVPFFINANVFIVSIIAAVVLLRYLIHQRFVSEFGLQHELEKQKEQLAMYSTHLEQLVQARTKELNKSEQWHRSLFENATDSIMVLDKNGIIVNANEKTCEMHGFSKDALVGAHIKLLEDNTDDEKISERIRRILLAGESIVYETKHNKKDGTFIFVEVSAKAITIGNEVFIQSFYRDITEKKKFQEHLFQSQKMDSIGVLAGGIAHDFNNMLTAIIGHAEIIRKNSVLDVKATNSLSVIEDASRRAGRMIQRLLGFARKSKYELVPLSLNDLVYDTLKLLERVIDKNIEMNVELDSHLPFIQGDMNHIEQIVMNLIINARDAMPKGGKIVIKTSVVNVRQGMPGVPPYILPGEYVMLNINDTGSGMPEDVRNRIFEPFFTTKERGKGTGLGLSMVYGAVKEHKGYITVTSEVGMGTSFSIYLPVSQSAALAPKAEEAASLMGNETLLIVDDEVDLLNAVQGALDSHGYKTVAIDDSQKALNIFKKIPQEISLVITDIAMPNMDGKELIKKIKEVKPDIKILAMSGHTKYVADKDGIREIDGFLKKPFESPYLLSVVRRILDAKTRTALTI